MMSIIYTDGACREPLKVKDGMFASWAFVLIKRENSGEHIKGEVITWRSGYVEESQAAETFIGAERATNQTAELSGVYWAGWYLRKMKILKATIFTDSRYAMNIVSGQYGAKANLKLVTRTRRLFFDTKYRIKWIRGHVGHRFNEMADSLAKDQLRD